LKVQSREEANAIVLERLKSSYGERLNVEFLRADWRLIFQAEDAEDSPTTWMWRMAKY